MLNILTLLKGKATGKWTGPQPYHLVHTCRMNWTLPPFPLQVFIILCLGTRTNLPLSAEYTEVFLRKFPKSTHCTSLHHCCRHSHYDDCTSESCQCSAVCLHSEIGLKNMTLHDLQDNPLHPFGSGSHSIHHTSSPWANMGQMSQDHTGSLQFDTFDMLQQGDLSYCVSKINFTFCNRKAHWKKL
jgi:hypothetical protein